MYDVYCVDEWCLPSRKNFAVLKQFGTCNNKHTLTLTLTVSTSHLKRSMFLSVGEASWRKEQCHLDSCGMTGAKVRGLCKGELPFCCFCFLQDLISRIKYDHLLSQITLVSFGVKSFRREHLVTCSCRCTVCVWLHSWMLFKTQERQMTCEEFF